MGAVTYTNWGGDLIFVGTVLVFFLVSYWFIWTCERLRR